MARRINNKVALKKLNEKRSCVENSKMRQKLSIDRMLDGKLVGGYKRSDETLGKALEYAGENGKLLTLPELIQARMLVDYDHKYWGNEIIAYSEHNIGVDYEGKYYGKGENILLTIHGGGLIDQETLANAYDEIFDQVCVVHSKEEFMMMLNGRDKQGNSFPIYTYQEIEENKGVNCLHYKHGIVTPYELIKHVDRQVYVSKEEYLKDPLLLTFMESKDVVELYYEYSQKIHDKKGFKGQAFFMESSHQGFIKEYFSDGERRPRGALLSAGESYFSSGILSSLFYTEFCQFIVVKPLFY